MWRLFPGVALDACFSIVFHPMYWPPLMSSTTPDT
jgi:hypothetical protein